MKIDSTGTFIGTILESGLGLTKKGFPQATLRLKAEQKYIETAADIAHFKLENPAYVDWSAFNEDIVAFLVLFNSADKFIPEGPDKTSLLNYEQIQIATGWDGTEFDSLSDGSMVGKKILFRVEDNTYEGKTSLQVNWIDSADAPPERTLKTLDATAIKSLNSKLQITKTAKPAAPAKPATATKPAAAVPTPAAVAASTTPAPTPSPVAAPALTTPTSAPAAPPAKKKAAAKTPPPPAPVAETTPGGAPKETTKLEAWEYVNNNKGDNEDQVLEEAWMSALSEVAGTRDEDALAPGDWAKVRDITIKDLAA